MSESWNIPIRKSNCTISILIEKINSTLPLFHSIFFQLFHIFSSNVHIPNVENGIILTTFSIHSVFANCLFPFTISQMPHIAITSVKRFIQRFRFYNVINKIIEVTYAKKEEFSNEYTFFKLLIPCYYSTLPSFACCARLICK